MTRTINFESINTISIVSEYNHQTIYEESSLIFEKDGNYFFIFDENEKLQDVSQMPDYIKSDWINYNKTELSIKEINRHIKYYNSILENEKWVFSSYKECKEYEDLLSKLINIRRDLIINGLIN
jgi:hypothetical protein